MKINSKLLNSFDKYTVWADYLSVILSIFTCTFFIYRDFGLRMIFGYALLFLILVVNAVRRVYHSRPIQLSTMGFAFLFLCVVVFLNFLRLDSRHDSDGTSFIIAMLVCCACILLVNPTEQDGKLALKVLYISAVIMAVYVLFFVLFDDLFWVSIYKILSSTARDYLAYYVPKGYSVTVGGCTYTNYILYFGMTACIGYLVSTPKRDKKFIVALVSAIVFLITILLVGRRGELLSGIFCCALLGFIMCTKKQRRFLLIYGSIAIVVILTLVILFLPQLKHVDVFYRYALTIENLLKGKDITSGRTELYGIAFKAFLKHPIFGIGLDQFHTLIPQEFLALHGADVEDVHNIYLQFLCEMGIVGAVLIIAPLGYIYYNICAQFRRLKRQKLESKQFNLAFELCCTSFMIQSFILFIGIYDPCFQRIIFWCFYGISIILMIYAMSLENYRPDDVVSRFIYRIIHRISPAGKWIWNKLSVFSKENISK